MDKSRIEVALDRLVQQQTNIIDKIKKDPYLVDWTDTYDVYEANDAKINALMKAIERINDLEDQELYGSMYLMKLKQVNEYLHNTIKHYV